MKTCKLCDKVLPLDEFYVNKNRPDGRHYYCKGCCKLRRRLDALKKREYIAKRQYKRALEEGVEADPAITLRKVYLVYRGHCALCESYVVPSEASLDHKIPITLGGGHVMDNVQLTHILCNRQKGVKSHDEARARPKKSWKRKHRKSPFER